MPPAVSWMPLVTLVCPECLQMRIILNIQLFGVSRWGYKFRVDSAVPTQFEVGFDHTFEFALKPNPI